MNLEKREIRTIASSLSLRESSPDEKGNHSESRTVQGYAIVFNQESEVLDDWGMRFTEIIEPSCVTAEYLNKCDVKMTLFHNREKLLARWQQGEGSLRLSVDEKGVAFEFEAPETEFGRFCLEGVKRGDLSGCSFTFAPGDYEIEERGKDDVLIRHKRFDWMGEMTIGSDPAYKQTSVNVREKVEGLPKHTNDQQIERESVKAQLEKKFNSLFTSKIF